MNVFDLVATLSLDTSNYQEGIQDAKKSGSSLGDNLKSAGKTIGVAGAAVAGVGAGLFKFADGIADNADEIDKMSQKLGLSRKAYQEWGYVLELSGADINSMSAGIKTLTNKFDDAINGGESSIEMFEKLGLSIEDIKDLSREELFSEVIFAFQGMEDNAERAALATDLLGRSGAELTPLLNTTAEETKGLIQEVNDLGGIMSDDAVKDGAKFKDSLTSLKTAFGGAAAELGKELMPYITDFVNKITDFVKSGGIGKITNAFKKMIPVIAAATAGFVAYKTAIAISSVIKALTSATEGMSVAQGILNAVMNANPFVLVATLIAGVTAAVVALWNTSDDFRGAITLMFEDIAEFFGNFWDGVKEIFADIPAFFSWIWEQGVEAIKTAWEGVVGFFSGIWEGIQGVFSAIGEWFSGIFTGAWEGIQTAWSEVTGWFGDIWEGIQEVFSGAWGSVTGWFGGLFLDAANAIGQAWSGVVDFFGRVWEKIKEKFGDVVGWFGRTFKKAAEKVAEYFNPFGIVEVIQEGAEGFKDFTMGVIEDITGYNSASATGTTMNQNAGDTNVNVFIGDEQLDGVIATSQQRQNLRSGGRN